MSTKLTKITGAGLIFLGVYLNVPFSILNAIFEYPQILREPTGKILTLFQQGGTPLIAAWYAFALAALLLIVAAKSVQRILKDEHEHLLSTATTFGVLAGLMQLLGLIRWVFVVPVLANVYADENSSEASKAAAVVVFQGFHQYAGVAVGEHLGQLFTALWILLIAVAMLDSAVFRKWQGFVGMAIAAAMLLGLAEGFATVADFDAGMLKALTPLSFIALSIWLMTLGSTLIWKNHRKNLLFGRLPFMRFENDAKDTVKTGVLLVFLMAAGFSLLDLLRNTNLTADKRGQTRIFLRFFVFIRVYLRSNFLVLIFARGLLFPKSNIAVVSGDAGDKTESSNRIKNLYETICRFDRR